MIKKTIEELNRLEIEEYKKKPKFPYVFLLDNVRSAHNVGSIFRTCDAFLVEKLFLCGITPKPPCNEIRKTALGATESVEWEYYENTIEAINILKSKNYKLIAVEQTKNSITFDELKRNDLHKSCFIFGNEVYGIDEEILTLCDFFLEIPQFGTKHSLNVAVCAGIVAFQVVGWLK